MIAYNITNNENGISIALMFNFKPYTLTSDNHKDITAVMTALRNKDKDILSILLEPVNFTNYVENIQGLEFIDGKITYNGEILDNAVSRKIEKFYKEAIPYEFLMAFLKNLMENPSEHSRKQLYTFMEANDLPINEDGHFVGYKRVSNEFKSLHSGKGTVVYPDGSEETQEKWYIPNNVGNQVSVDRDYVTADPKTACSYGLHVGSLEYVKHFSNQVGNPIVLVTVNPRDVVSVPEDSSFQKLRTCNYTVIGMFEKALADQAYTTKQEAAPLSVSKTSKDGLTLKEEKDVITKHVIRVLSARADAIKYDRSQAYSCYAHMINTLAEGTNYSVRVVMDVIQGAGYKNTGNAVRKSSVLEILTKL